MEGVHHRVKAGGFSSWIHPEIDLVGVLQKPVQERVRDRWFVDVRAVSDIRHLEQDL